MIIVSIDCGVKNLAYSIIELKEPIIYPVENLLQNFIFLNRWNIIDIKNVDIRGKGVIAQYRNLVSQMNSIEDKLLSNRDSRIVILIERQIMINSKMFAIFSSIITYFLTIPDREIVIIHPNMKNSLIRSMVDLDGKKRIKFLNSYTYNKSCAIDFIQKINETKEWIPLLDYHKKDDICDCIIQMLAYLLKK